MRISPDYFDAAVGISPRFQITSPLSGPWMNWYPEVRGTTSMCSHNETGIHRDLTIPNRLWPRHDPNINWYPIPVRCTADPSTCRHSLEFSPAWMPTMIDKRGVVNTRQYDWWLCGRGCRLNEWRPYIGLSEGGVSLCFVSCPRYWLSNSQCLFDENKRGKCDRCERMQFCGN